MTNPMKDFTKREWGLWLGSLLVVITSNMLSGKLDVLTLIATCVGVTSLIFAAKGNVWAPILMVFFSILYGIISWRFCYWGEMITYLGMTMPMSIWTVVTWLKNPAENGREVAIQRLTVRHIVGLVISGAIVTGIFFFPLQALHTPNLLFSTISITTTFFAAALTMLRSSYYALWYAVNDVVLIVLWVLASANDPVYIPVVVNFMIFLVNDLYGFISWKRREHDSRK